LRTLDIVLVDSDKSQIVYVKLLGEERIYEARISMRPTQARSKSKSVFCLVCISRVTVMKVFRMLGDSAANTVQRRVQERD
jgi:hypothetical protein